MLSGSELVQAFGNAGNDSVLLRPKGTGSIRGGTEEKDSICGPSGTGSMLLFGNEGVRRCRHARCKSASEIVGGAQDLDDGSNNDPDELGRLSALAGAKQSLAVKGAVFDLPQIRQVRPMNNTCQRLRLGGRSFARATDRHR